MNYVTVRRPHNGLSVTSDFDRLFDTVFGTMPGWSDTKPAVDIRTNEEGYLIEADLPGMDESQIDVRVENDLLVIQARNEREATPEGEENADNWIVRERRSRSFYRSFALPKDADANTIEARFRNGVLSIALHKRAEAKPRQIEIKRG